MQKKAETVAAIGMIGDVSRPHARTRPDRTAIGRANGEAFGEQQKNK